MEVKSTDKRRPLLLRHVMKLYDAKASFYDDLHGYEQKIKHSIVLHRIKNRLEKAVSYLDCGCGTGILLEELRGALGRANRRLVGLDLSAGMLEAALNKVGCGDLHLVRGDSNNAPFKGSSFDLIFAFTLLDGEANGVDTLRELCRVCSENGLIVASMLRPSRIASTFPEYAKESGLEIMDVIDFKGLNEVILLLVKRGRSDPQHVGGGACGS
ncbi:class I SAM-dependent methyltransferase [Candidatus Bathyarchaeota archaeon]|nr:class I SAM-dependent methyltransferase [Candidatus Bathyarchaeota archaeon]